MTVMFFNAAFCFVQCTVLWCVVFGSGMPSAFHSLGEVEQVLLERTLSSLYDLMYCIWENSQLLLPHASLSRASDSSDPMNSVLVVPPSS